MKKLLKIFTAGVLFFFFIFYSLELFRVEEVPPEIEEDEEIEEEVKGTATITSSIRMQDMTIKVYPEKREPETGNWDTFLDLRIRDAVMGTLLFQRNGLATDANGEVTIIPIPAETIPGGTKPIYIKGYSHITKRYDSVHLVDQHEYADFTPFGDLPGGDTAVPSNDVVDLADVYATVSMLNTNDYRNDLNQDSLVNSLDLSILLYNFGRSGEM